MPDPIIIYSATISPRLRYVLDWIFNERLQYSYTLTDDITIAKENSFLIAYGKISAGDVNIPAAGLVFEAGVRPHDIATGAWQNIPTLYAIGEQSHTLPFDLFSATFFLLSRYEEYYNYTPDKHGRYPATESILFKNNWLERPLVDEWINAFKKLLAEKGNIKFPEQPFSFLPTYDIDIAYSYKYKGAVRSIGGIVKSLLPGAVGTVSERIAVLSGKRQDPYDSFEFIRSLHSQYHYNPTYFILAALTPGPFDKNIDPLHPAMQALIKSFTAEGHMGMHPSYDTDKDLQRFNAERSILEKISDTAISISRQHYMKLVLPVTYRKLIAERFTNDYSMGYGTQLGFRAGTGTSFLWYDTEQEKVTTLRVHPFCFMDTTARYEMGLSANEAFKRLKKMIVYLKATDSRLITIFHNFSLGTDMEWGKAWPEHYSLLFDYLAAILTNG